MVSLAFALVGLLASLLRTEKEGDPWAYKKGVLSAKGQSVAYTTLGDVYLHHEGLMLVEVLEYAGNHFKVLLRAVSSVSSGSNEQRSSDNLMWQFSSDNLMW